MEPYRPAWPRLLQVQHRPDAGLLLQWEIFQTPSGKFVAQAKGSPFSQLPGRSEDESPDTQLVPVSEISYLAGAFRLPWSHYVQLLAVDNPNARGFYEAEALRGGWSVRQLRRQIGSQFYERTALSKDKAGMLIRGRKARPEDAITPEEELKDPFVLEFLELKDQYSESELEESLIRHIESFLLELGNDFAFIGRQKRLRVDDEWYRIDLVFFHRSLRVLILIDLKLQKLTPGDIGQMNFYLNLNYAREHWTRPDENPPVGLILCADHGGGVAKYALEGLAQQGPGGPLPHGLAVGDIAGGGDGPDPQDAGGPPAGHDDAEGRTLIPNGATVFVLSKSSPLVNNH